MNNCEWYALFLFLYSKDKYIQLALNYSPWMHSTCDKYKEECLQLKHELIKYNVTDDTLLQFNTARSSFFKSFLLTAFLASVSLSVGCINGTVSTNLQPNYSKILSFSGVVILTWAGIYQLRYSGERGGFGMELNKIVHKAFFVFLLVVGSMLSMAGAI